MNDLVFNSLRRFGFSQLILEIRIRLTLFQLSRDRDLPKVTIKKHHIEIGKLRHINKVRYFIQVLVLLFILSTPILSLYQSNVAARAIQWMDGNEKLLFGTIDCFLMWRLSNQKIHSTDATNACRTLLYNIHDGCWDEDLLDLFNIPASMLPEVYDNAADFGKVDECIFGSEIPISASIGDQPSALVGQACFQPGMVKSTYGTG